MQKNHISFKIKNNSQEKTNHNKYNKVSDADRVVELQFELKQAYSQIEVLKQTNRNILDKLQYYERKCQDKRILQDELQFRKQQEKTIQQHLDHYQIVNHKLKAKIIELERYIGNQQQLVKSTHLSTHQHSQSQLESSLDYKNKKNQKNLHIQLPKHNSTRKIITQNKENHNLTPKTRVSYDFQKIQKSQMDPLLKIKERRKVFL